MKTLNKTKQIQHGRDSIGETTLRLDETTFHAGSDYLRELDVTPKGTLVVEAAPMYCEVCVIHNKKLFIVFAVKKQSKQNKNREKMEARWTTNCSRSSQGEDYNRNQARQLFRSTFLFQRQGAVDSHKTLSSYL